MTNAEPAIRGGHAYCPLTIGVLALLGALGIAAVLWVTPYGAGVTPDGIRYLEGARHLLKGEGYSTLTSGELKPVTHWPPFFSIAIASVSLSGVDGWTGARWLNAVVMGVNIWLTGFLVLRFTRAPPVVVIFAALLMLISWDNFAVHTCVLSDGLFMALSLGGLTCLLGFLERPSGGQLLGSAVLFGLATLTRYFGVPLIGAGAVSLLLWRRGSLKQRVADSLAFGSIAVVPLIAFAVRNRFVGKESGGDVFTGFHPSHGLLQDTFHALIAWFIPSQLPSVVRLGIHVVAALGILGFIVLLIRYSQALTRPVAEHRGTVAGSATPDANSWRSQTFLVAVVSLTFVVAYLLFYLFSVSFLVQAMELEDVRYMVPLKPLLVLGIAALMTEFLRETARPRAWSGFAGIAFVLLAVGSAARAVPWLESTRRDGQVFAGNEWRQSEAMEMAGKVRPGVEIFSNWPDVILFQTGKPARSLPMVWDTATERPRKDYDERLAVLRDRLRTHKGVIVYFTHKEQRLVPTRERLEKDLGLSVVSRARDGVIYELNGEDGGTGQRAENR